LTKVICTCTFISSQEEIDMPKLFTPSSSKLMSMIAAAEAKCDASIAAHKDAVADARMERFLTAQAKAQQWRRMCER
jgi:hypothetical protein